MKEGQKAFDIMPPAAEAPDRGGSGFNTPFRDLRAKMEVAPPSSRHEGFREIKEGEAFEPGREFKMDVSTGRNYVREKLESEPSEDGWKEVADENEVKPKHRARVTRDGRVFVKEDTSRSEVKNGETLEEVKARVPDLGPTLELLTDPKLGEEQFIELMGGFNVVHGKDQTRLFDRIEVPSPIGKVWVKVYRNGSVTITGAYDAERAAAVRPESPKFEPVPMPRVHQPGEIVEGEGFVMGRKAEVKKETAPASPASEASHRSLWDYLPFHRKSAEEKVVGLGLGRPERTTDPDGSSKKEAPAAEKKTPERSAPAERPEMEPFLKALAERRAAYGESYRDAVKKAGPEKKYKEALKLARIHRPEFGDDRLLAGEDSEARREARIRKQEYVELLMKHGGLSESQGEALYERDLREAEYKASKNDYKNKFLGTRFEELAQQYRKEKGKLPKDLDESEQREFREKMAEARLELYQKLVVHEADELAIEKAKGMDDRTKRLLMKMLERGRDTVRAYGEINRTWKGRLARMGATTVLVTGGAVALGAVAPAGMAVFAANRFRKTLMASALGVPIAQAINSGLDKIMGDPQKARDAKIAGMLQGVDVDGLKDLDLETVEQGHLKISKDYRKSLWKRAGIKASVAVMSGMGVSAALTLAEGDLFEPSAARAAEAPAADPGSEETGGGQFVEGENPRVATAGADEGRSEPEGGEVSATAAGEITGPQAQEGAAGENAADTGVSESDMERLSEVRQGEGAWHAVRRQLAARQGFGAEDLEKPEVKAELDRQTMNVLKESGFVGEGGERWVMQPGAHVKLGEDGRLEYDEAATSWRETGGRAAADELAGPETPVDQGVVGEYGVPELEGGSSEQAMEKLDAATKAHYAERLAGIRAQDEALDQEIKELGAHPDPEKLAEVVDKMKALKANVDELRAEIGSRAVAETAAGISPERAVESIENVKKAATLASFSETVMDRSEFPKALNHQLAEHMTGYNNLPSNYRREISVFLMQQLEADKSHKLLPVNLDEISRTRVNFAPLLENKALMADALQFPREARLLENFGFHSGDYLSSEYLQVLRKVPVSEYLEQAKANSRPGEIMEFVHEGKTAVVVPDDAHMKLARAMGKFPQSEVGDMSLAEFLKHYDTHK